jgi:hypothetical protein
MCGNCELGSRSNKPRILHIVFLGYQSPLAGVVVFFPGEVAQGHTAFENPDLATIGRVFWRLLELLFNGLVFAKSDVEFCPQRYTPWAEEIEFFTNALNYTFRRERRAERKKFVSPKELTTWRSMRLSVDLEEFVHLACLFANVFDIV